MALQIPKEAPGLSKTCLLRAHAGLVEKKKKRCALSLLSDMEGRTGHRKVRGGAWAGGVWVKTRNNGPLSRREGPSVKCVFLQFEKVESGQIGVLLSSDRMSYVTVGGGGEVRRVGCTGGGRCCLN